MGIGGNGAVSAEFERHLIKARTDEGVKAARARGMRVISPLLDLSCQSSRASLGPRRRRQRRPRKKVPTC
jgi:DNA invertase Pin-like site-specific DNA recombinase